MIKTTMAAIVLTGATAASAADLTISSFAPDTSVLVVSMDDIAPIVTRMQGSPLSKMLWSEDYIDMDSMMDAGSGPMVEAMRKMREDGDVMEQISQIGFGMAMYTESDPETGGVHPHVMGYVNLRGNMDMMKEHIDELFEMARKEGGETIEVAGRDCLMVPGGESSDEQPGGFRMGPDMSSLDSMDFYGYMDEDKGILLFASSVTGMERAMDGLDGEDVESPLADDDDWKGIMGMIGDGGPSAVLLTRHMADMVSAFDSSGMMGFMGGTLVAATGKINALGMSIEAGESPAMLQARAGLYMPEGKSGIIELMSRNSDRENLPALLETEIYGMGRYNFDFAGVIDWIKTIIRSNPFIQAQGMQSLEQIEPTLSALLDSLDGTMISMESISRPITMDSMFSIMAMESKDTQKFNDAFTTLASDMGMEQGDFQGHTIYTLGEEGMFMPGMPAGADMAVAMGGDYVMMGNRTGIEEALRNVGNRGELELTPNLKAGLAVLPDRALSGWNVQDIFRYMDDAMEIEEMQMEQSLKELAEDDPELAEEIRAEMKEERALQGGLMKELAETLGGYAFAMWSTEKGMMIQASLLEVVKDGKED